MVTPHLISTLLVDAAQWDSHAPAYAPIMAIMGHAEGATQSSQADAPRLLHRLQVEGPVPV